MKISKNYRLLPAIALTCILSMVAYQPALAQYPDGISKRTIKKEMAYAKKKGGPKATALSDVCATTKPLSNALLKNAWPGHINLSDPRASGFAFVCGSDCASKFPVTAYYSDGTQAFRLGYYGVWSGNGKPRAYCSVGGAARCSASAVTRNAKRSGRDGKVYLVFNKKTKSCRTATPGKRNGSTS